MYIINIFIYSCSSFQEHKVLTKDFHLGFLLALCLISLQNTTASAALTLIYARFWISGPFDFLKVTPRYLVLLHHSVICVCCVPATTINIVLFPYESVSARSHNSLFVMILCQNIRRISRRQRFIKVCIFCNSRLDGYLGSHAPTMTCFKMAFKMFILVPLVMFVDFHTEESSPKAALA